MRTRHFSLIALAGVVLLSLLGCQQQDAIETHLEPRPEDPPDKVRLLGAMIHHGNETWFLKLVGPLDAIEKRKDEFDAFVRSVKFPKNGDPPIAWNAPKDWERLPGNEFRFATLRLGPKDSSLEVSISKLTDEGEAASILANVNRWRKLDLGVKPVFDDELPNAVQKIGVDGEVATLVDMKGPGSNRPSKGPPMMAGRKPAGHPGAGKAPLDYTVPPGWEPGVNNKGAAAEFRIKDGAALARVTLTRLFGPAGGLVANVNRWRTEQLGLPAWSDREVRDHVQKIETRDGEAEFVDLIGSGAAPDRVLVAIVPHEGDTWFIKMIGPANLVGKQEPAFKKFVKSVRFDGGNDG